MAMQKVYSPINWENYPSDSTPINETNLNKIDSAIDSIDNRVISIDTTKASKSEVSSLVSEITYDEDTGAFTITKMNGSSFTIDTKLEKIAINFAYDPVNEQIIITLDDGTKQYIDLSALITQYEFLESSTIAFEVDSAGKVSAKIKNASVTEEMLQPNYLADIKVQVAKAEKSQSAAELSETNANASAAAAKVSETSASTSAAAAKQSEIAAKASETAAALSESNAQNYSDDANSAAASASAYQNDAKNSAAAAKQSEVAAKASEANAKLSESAAKTSETSASESASNAQEYASGKTNSAKYYYEQCKAISESFAGSLRPMGTVKFAELPALSLVTAGDMYNISDEFVTTTDFKEGTGNTQAAGTNVYKTVDGMWDCLAGSPVTGVKGANETTFRRGNVNITPENIGALASEGNAKDTTVTFTQATARANVTSGDKMSILFGKIAKWFTDLKTVAFTGKYSDLENAPKKEWTATVHGSTWSRLCHISAYKGLTTGSSFILNVSASRTGVLYNATFAIKTYLNRKATITKLSSTSVSSFALRLMVDATGNCYVELYDNANKATASTIQSVECSIISLNSGEVEEYTDFTDGTATAANYSVGASIINDANGLQGNLDWKYIVNAPTVDSALSETSENAVQNKAVTAELNSLSSKIDNVSLNFTVTGVDVKAALSNLIVAMSEYDTGVYLYHGTWTGNLFFEGHFACTGKNQVVTGIVIFSDGNAYNFRFEAGVVVRCWHISYSEAFDV